MRFARVLWLLILLLILAACSGSNSDQPVPPTIHYGEDICEFCGMIISEERYAAAYVTVAGHGHAFDDIVDMVQAHLEKQEDVSAFFVHDYNDKNWIRAEIAYYVLSQELPTPMLSGLAAFTSAERAQEFITELGEGQILTFNELFDQYRTNPPTPFLGQ